MVASESLDAALCLGEAAMNRMGGQRSATISGATENGEGLSSPSPRLSTLLGRSRKKGTTMRRSWLASVLPPRGRTPLRWRLSALVAAALPLALGVGVPSSASASPTYTVTATLGLPGPPNAVAVYPLAKTVYISGGILTPLPFGWFYALDTTTYHAVPFYQLAQPLGGYTGLAVNPIANRLYEAYSIPPTPTPIGVLQFQRASYTLPAPVLGPSIGPQGSPSAMMRSGLRSTRSPTGST